MTTSEYFEKGTAYNTAVAAIGYAGVFAIWQLVKPPLAPGPSAAVGLLLLFSIAIFAAWTVTKMVVDAVAVPGLVVEGGALRGSGARRLMVRIWPWAVGLSAVPALVAAIILAVSFGGSLVHEYTKALGCR